MTTAYGDWGAEIVRGDDPGDHFTKLHNLLARCKMLPPEYVGAFTYLLSHDQGWRTTEQQMMRDLGRGRTYVRSALAAMEKANLLRRGRVRNPDGTLGASRWWVSGLAAVLQQLGFDEETVRQRVDQEAEKCFRSSAPMSRNATQATTSENAAADAPNKPGKDGLSGFMPKSRYPTLDNQHPKKTNKKEDQPSSPTPPREAAGSTAGAAEAGRQEPETSTQTQTRVPNPRRSSRANRHQVQEHPAAAGLVDRLEWPGTIDRARITASRRTLITAAASALAAGHHPDAVRATAQEAMPGARTPGSVVAALQKLADQAPDPAIEESARRAAAAAERDRMANTRHKFVPDAVNASYCQLCGRTQAISRIHGPSRVMAGGGVR